MAELGSYSIPKEFKDEDKWFRYFTKKNLLYAGAAIGIDAVILTVTSSLHILPAGVSMSEIILVVALAVSFVTIPPDKYLIGGGYNLSVILLRLILKRLPKNRILYVKHYGFYED